MTAVLAFACDAIIDDLESTRPPGWPLLSGPCPVVSRPARSDALLRIVAGRDGWLIDGPRHLCPTHAAQAQAPADEVPPCTGCSSTLCPDHAGVEA